MSFQDILGQKAAVQILQDQLQKERVSHAYLFTGKEGVGKKTLAFQFARALNCPEGEADSCDQCLSCRRIEHFNHPDVSLLEPADGGSIGIDEIRKMQKDISFRPYQGKWRVFIIDGADRLTPEAANSLLKTLEEPPGYVVIILLAREIDKLLPTVISRCQQVPLTSLTQQVITGEIKRRFPGNEQAEVISRMADGSLGRALKLAGNEELLQFRKDFLNFLYQLPRSSSLDIFKEVDQLTTLLKSEGEELLFNLLVSWYRDIMLYNQGVTEGLVNFDHLERIKSQGGMYNIEELIRIIEAINNFRRYLKMNIRADLVLQVLFFKIRAKRVGK